MENSNIDQSNRQSTSRNSNFHINTNPPIHISPLTTCGVLRSSANSEEFYTKAENDNNRFRRPNLPYHEYSPEDYVLPAVLNPSKAHKHTPNPHATVHTEHNSIFVSARPPNFFSVPGDEAVFYENAPSSSSTRHDSSGYIDRNGLRSTGSVHSFASDIASDMDVASDADFNSPEAGNNRTLANRIVFVRSLIEAINSPEVTKIQWCPKGNCVMFHDRMKEEPFRQEWRAIIGESRSRSDEPATIIRNLNTYGWNKVNKQGKIKRQTHSCDCQTTTNPPITSTDFYFNINCTKLKIDTIGLDACIEEIRKKRLFPKIGGEKRKTMKETISSLHSEIESLKEQLRQQQEQFEQQHEITRNQAHELAHKNSQLSMKNAEINDKNTEIKRIKRALEIRCAQTKNAEQNNASLMNTNSSLAKKLEESENINKKLRANTEQGKPPADVGVESTAGVIYSQ